jgi:hypothetical protein
MSKGCTINDLVRLENEARAESDAAAEAERAWLKEADDAEDPVEKKIALSLSQIQGCHKRHAKRIANAYAIARSEAEG